MYRAAGLHIKTRANLRIHSSCAQCMLLVCKCIAHARPWYDVYAMFAEWKRAKLILICLWISGMYVRKIKPDRLFSSLMFFHFSFCVVFLFLFIFIDTKVLAIGTKRASRNRGERVGRKEEGGEVKREKIQRNQV